MRCSLDCLGVAGEWAVRDIANHSLVVTKDIERGEMLGHYNVGIARPGTGIPAALYEDVLYKGARKNLTAGTLLMYDDFAQSV